MIKKVENKLRAKKKCYALRDDSKKKKKQYSSDNTIQCVICDKRFLHKGAMKMHSRAHHI